MSPHPAILRIDATRTTETYFEFTVVMDGPNGEYGCIVSVDALIDYLQFQRELLAKAGVFYRYAMCEGREPLHANEFWKELIASFLRTARITTAANMGPVN